jgi:hypothetical protein
MNKFLLTLVAVAGFCGPLAAHAAIVTDQAPAAAQVTAGVPAQISRLDRQVMALNSKVKMLQEQNMSASQQALFASTDGG